MRRFKKSYDIDGWPVEDTENKTVLSKDELINLLNDQNMQIKGLTEVVQMTVEQAGAELNNSIKPFNPQMLYSKGIDALAAK